VPRSRPGALPNLIVIGGLKCGTTSLHHYLNLHPEVGMSRPKELNFFVAELNWPLGEAWYASHFPADAPVRGESSPHYTNLPRFTGVAERMGAMLPDARIVYMIRDPIDRALSHYLHNVAGGYEKRPLEIALAEPGNAYVARGLYAMQIEPYLEQFGEDRVEIVVQEDLKARRDETVRRVFEFIGVDRSASGRRAPASAPDASAQWTAPCACPACGRSTATSTGCPSRSAGSWSGSSTTPTPRASSPRFRISFEPSSWSASRRMRSGCES
jgi:hypothetical protein